MIVSNEEEKIVREGARHLSAVMERLLKRVAVGVSGNELSGYADELISGVGATPAFKGYGKPPFPAPLCVSVNDCVVHGVPSSRVFRPGDVVGLDIGIIYKGFYSDMARTVALPPVSQKRKELVECARRALEQAIAAVKPGATIGDIGFTVQRYVESCGFGVVRDLAGHGIGRALHENPQIPNFGSPGSGSVLQQGMVLAIEPMITAGNYKVRHADDGWGVLTVDGSTTAHFEDMVLVTALGCDVVTRIYEKISRD